MDNDFEELRRWQNNIPDLYHGAYRRTWLKAVGKESMRAAINAKCQDCMNWQQSEVKRCDVITCPLWQYRPLQDKAKKREKAIQRIARQFGDAQKGFGCQNGARGCSVGRKRSCVKS